MSGEEERWMSRPRRVAPWQPCVGHAHEASPQGTRGRGHRTFFWPSCRQKAFVQTSSFVW